MQSEGVGVEVLLVCWFREVPLHLPCVNVTLDSSSDVELYPSSWNRGADEFRLEAGDAGRGMHGVRGLCGPGGSIGAVTVRSAETVSGDWVV